MRWVETACLTAVLGEEKKRKSMANSVFTNNVGLGRVRGHHLEDQIANFLGYGSSSNGLPDLGDQHPVPTETGAMPADHGFGCDNQECLLPAGPAAPNDQPEEPVEQLEPLAWMTAFQYRKLLA